MQKIFSITFVMIAISWSILFAQESSTPQIFQSINNDTSTPLRDMEEAPLTNTPWEDGVIPLNKLKPRFEDHYQKDQSLQKMMGTTGTSDIIQSWDGISAGPYVPPDPSGDVGPNHYMQMVNIQFQIWNKTGTSLLGPYNLSTLWSGFPGPWASNLNDGDPVVLYDETADRWFASQFSIPNGTGGPNYILVAISQTGDPTGSWYRYGFEFPNFPDYPKYGVWPDGYYVSANRFGGSGGTSNAAFERSKMLIGAPAQMVIFNISSSISWSLLPSDWDGTNSPPTGAPNYFGQIHDNANYGGSDGFDIFQFHVDWVTPGNSTFTGPTFMATNAFSQLNGIPQPSPGETLDDLSDRAMNRLNYRNFGTHQSMVVCHTVDAGGSRAGMRWYEFRKTTGSWSLYQQGTYAPADGLERWMGSIAINNNGDIALGYSASSSTVYPSIRYTGRLSGDALGTMTIPEEVIQAGLGSQIDSYGRWGDYTQMAVDPNGQTFWYLNEYYPSTSSFNWKTRIASFSFGPPCPVNQPTNPNPLNGTTDLSINIPSISWINGSGATQCEVWFGELGSMAKVHDGSLIASWTISGPLSYNTPYSWQIVGKNGTCSVSGPLWTFTTEPDPNLVIETVLVYPQDINYWTGTCNSSSKTQVSLVNANGNGFAGWMAFDVSSIPTYATINSIKFNGYLYANNYPFWSVTPMGTVNPVTGSASAIFNQVSNNYSQSTAYSYNEESGSLTNGWIQRTLGTTAAMDLQNALGQGWYAIGIYDWDSGTTYYVDFQGWAQANRPYLEIVYEYTVVADPTGVSATPLSNAQIDVAFTANTSNNNVVIAWSLADTFTEPSGLPPSPGQPFAGGTLLYNGTVSPVNHIGLTELTTYYYKLFSYDGINYSQGVDINATTTIGQATIDLSVVIQDNEGASSTINFGLDLLATDGIDITLGEAELPGFPPGGYAAAWLLPDFTTLSYNDYRAPGNPPAFPFTGHKSYVIKIQDDLTANPITFSWNLPSAIAATSTIGVSGDVVSFSGTGSHSWNYNPVSLQYILIEVDFIDIDSVETFEFTVPVTSGWNMVSAPGLNTPDQNVGTWWPNLTGTVWGFNGTIYQARTVTTPGEGYWMKNVGSETYSYTGIEIVTHNAIAATAGWNMIGGYETSVATSGLTTVPSGQQTGTIWGFNGTVYTAATTFEPGKGYWVKTLSACDIVIPEALSKGSGEVVDLFKEDWGKIILTDAAGKSYTLYAVKGEVDLDQYEMPPAVPGGMFDIRFSSGRIAEDINSSMQSIDMIGITYPLTVRVEGMDIRLQDMSGRAINQNLKSGEEVVINDATINKLMITGELIPTVYALEQNYPNPFNPSTVIEFSLPEDVSNVKLSIYNALGEKVAEIVNSSLAAGRYSYQWNAKNVATGMYIYELRTDKFVSVRKMVLMK